jgi:recombination protein RecT
MSEIAQRTPMQEVVAAVRGDDFRGQIESALPGNVTPDRFVRVTVTALRENPDVLDADRSTLFSALIKCAQDGLLPDAREAALVVFKGKVVYMPMIGGFRKIAAEYGWSIRTQVVYANDEFEFELGLEPKLIHRPPRLNAQRGEMVGAYAVATHKDGRKEVEVLTSDEIAKVRATSRAKDSGPWRDWTERMWEKTAGRRLFAKLPLGERDQELIARVLEASKPLEPGAAAEMLYGPAREVTPAPGTAPADIDGEAHPVDVDQQTEEADAELSPDESASSVPGPEFDGDEPTPSTATPNETDTPAPTFGSGRYVGKTIVEIYSEGKEGISYLKWALKSWKSEPMKTAVAEFAKTHPEIT